MIQFDVTMHLAGLLDVHAAGGAGVYNDGIALVLAVSIDVSVFDIIKIQASGTLKLNTSDSTRTLAGIAIAPNSFRLTLNGSISILEVIRVAAGFDIIVGGNQTVTVGSGETASTQTIHSGEWVFSFTGSLDFFGIVTVTAERLDQLARAGSTSPSTPGSLSARPTSVSRWGSTSTCILDQNPTTHIYRFGISASGGASLRAFGFTFASVSIGFSLSAEGVGPRADHRQRARVDLVLLLLRQRQHVVHARLHRAAEAGVPRRPGGQRLDPELAEDFNPSSAPNGILYLNIGDRSAARGLGECTNSDSSCDGNETYYIEHIDGGPGGETVKVKYAGREQVFTGVTKIIGNLGKGDDQVFVRAGIRVPVELYGEDGNDVLVYEGSNTAILDGGDGNDYLRPAPHPQRHDERRRRLRLHQLQRRRRSRRSTAAPTATRSTAAQATTRSLGGTGDDEIDGRGGNDSIDAGDGNDVVHWTIDGVTPPEVDRRHRQRHPLRARQHERRRAST